MSTIFCNYNLYAILQIIGVVTTYLVIFIQFDQSSTVELEATNDTCSSVKY